MADAIVTQIFESLSTALSLERSRLKGVKEQVDLLQLKFRFMKRLLRDAEMKTKTPGGVVEEIIVLAHDVEDVIDSYLLYLEQQNTKNPFIKAINSHNKLVTLHRFSKDIEAINTRAQTISDLKSEYINTTEAAESSDASATNNTWRRAGIPTTQEIDVVGFQDESLRLINLLKEEVLHRRVISIIGMGGGGKTTLAQMIYSHPNVTNYFDTRIWISLSQQYQERDVLVSALKPFMGQYVERMNMEELKEQLYEKLSIRRYLLIVDDIWNVDAWDQISQNFPNNNHGSRVLLTTRNKEVALRADPSNHNHHELRMLNRDESWELFLKKVFLMPEDSCPKELESLGREIVQKCGGIPLAILVAGGLLMGKDRSHEEWSRVNASLRWHLSQDSSKCRQILMLSYADLPYYLKSCFLYLGMFPEDFEIPAQKLIRLWVAEGFVQERGQLCMEDVAEDCLEQLCQRSLIQVKRRRYHRGPIETFRVHDLLRELVISEGKKYQFMDNNDKYTHHIPKPRRFAINLCVDEKEAKQLFTQTTRNLRCLLFFHPKFKMVNSWMSRFVNGNKLLRVLDLEGVEIKKELPKEIGDFTFLHYLGLCFTGVKSLPSSIGNLIKLQTLDLRHTLIEVLPESIWKLKNLRHLLFFHWLGGDEAKNIPFGKDVGNNLITLIGVSGVSWMNDDGTGLSNGFFKQKSLRLLCVNGKLAVNNHQSLRNCFPMSLTELFLVDTMIEEDPSATLGSLPLLKALYLQRESYVGKKMNFLSGTFLQLQYLYIGVIDMLSDWTVEDGAIPILRQLALHDLENLKRLPDGLRNVTSLQKIEVHRVPRVQHRIQRDGEDWHIVASIPNFEFTEFTGPPRVVPAVCRLQLRESDSTCLLGFLLGCFPWCSRLADLICS